MTKSQMVGTILDILVAIAPAAALWCVAGSASAADPEGGLAPVQAEATDAATDQGGEDHPEDADLQKKLQNPVASLVSVPFQDNLGFGTSPFGKTQNVMLMQPVIPIPLTADWNWIVRPILPVLAVPTGDQSTAGGLGDTVVQTFFSPSNPSKLIWGVGPNLQLPTGTNGLTQRQWGVGPSVVALMQPGHLTVGVLVDQTWGVGGQPHGAPYLSSFTFQPILAYALEHGWTVSSSSPWTADWSAHGEQWTIPVGVAVSKLLHIPHAPPLQLEVGAFDNVVRAEGQPQWFLRFEAVFILRPFWKEPWFGGR